MLKISLLTRSILLLLCFYNNIRRGYVTAANPTCVCNYNQCSATAGCCPGLTCVPSNPFYSQCLETANNTKGTQNCIATQSGFGCVTDNDCCNPHAKCISSFCNLPCSTTPTIQPTSPVIEPGFSIVSNFNTTQYNTGQYYYVSYLSRWNISCQGLGLNSFHLQYKYQSVPVNYGHYNIKCVSPGFNATKLSTGQNLKLIQGGTTPVANIKFFQYLTPTLANCSSVGGAITKLAWLNENSNTVGGYAYTCGIFGSFSLSRCRTVVNQPTTIGYTSYATGNMNFLDRQVVACNANEALQMIQWTYNGDIAMTGQYVYTCCQYEALCPPTSYYSHGTCYSYPSANPSSNPSVNPSIIPSANPSANPTVGPAKAPASSPTSMTLNSNSPNANSPSFPGSIPTAAPSLASSPVSISPTLIAQTKSGANVQNTFIQSNTFFIVIAISSFLCLLLLVTLYFLHKRWSLQNHSNQLWNWVANDLGGEVMVMIRGSRRLISKDHVYSVRTVPTYFPGGDDNSSRKSAKNIQMTNLDADKAVALPVLHEELI